MSAAPRGLPVRLIPEWTLGAIVFLTGFVMFEPAPADLILCAVAVIWAFCGLRISRYALPMVVLLIAYTAGGFLSFTQLQSFQKPLVYMATTAFLAISSIFFASVLLTDPARRLRVIERAYVASAVLCSLIGILAYFGAMPAAELFTLYDRAKGTFKDPNVFGPFLVLPLVVLTRAMLTSPPGDLLKRLPAFLILLAGVFLSFSRAAWGLAILALVVVAILSLVTEQRNTRRLRTIAYIAGGTLFIVLLLAVAVSIPAVQDLFVQRFKLVQDYDGGRLGRFERHVLGFFLIQEHPFGVGPFQFGIAMGEDEHNMWLKGFTVYGWLGGFAYIALVIWTLAIATPLVFRNRPWTPFVQSTYAVYLGHLMIHNVIDNDHWRHLFLIYGVLWGVYAHERRERRLAWRPERPPIPQFGPVRLSEAGLDLVRPAVRRFRLASFPPGSVRDPAAETAS